MNGKIIAILLAEHFAQALPDASAFEKYGLPGLVILYFMVRDHMQQKREETRQEKRAQEETARYAELTRALADNTQTLAGLVRVSSIEINSRSEIHDRQKEETKAILDKLPKKG